MARSKGCVRLIFRALSLVLLAFFMSSTSCSHVDVIGPPVIQSSGKLLYINATIAFTDRVDSDQRVGIYEGINTWNNALGDGIRTIEVPRWELWNYTSNKMRGVCQPAILFDVVSSTHKAIVDNDKKDSIITLGLTFHQRCGVSRVLLVEDRLESMYDFVNLSAHEVGHAMGLEHVKEDHAIMHKSYSSSVQSGCVTQPDAEELCDKLDCSPEKVRICD